MARLRVLRQLQMFFVLWRHKSGSALIEYSLIIAIVVGLVLAAVIFIGGWVSSMFSIFPTWGRALRLALDRSNPSPNLRKQIRRQRRSKLEQKAQSRVEGTGPPRLQSAMWTGGTTAAGRDTGPRSAADDVAWLLLIAL